MGEFVGLFDIFKGARGDTSVSNKKEEPKEKSRSTIRIGETGSFEFIARVNDDNSVPKEVINELEPYIKRYNPDKNIHYHLYDMTLFFSATKEHGTFICTYCEFRKMPLQLIMKDGIRMQDYRQIIGESTISDYEREKHKAKIVYLTGKREVSEKILNPDYGKKIIVLSEFEKNKKVSPEEFNRQSQEVSVSLMNLILRENALPEMKAIPHISTKSLDKNGVEIVLEFLKAKSNIAVLYGSYSIYQPLLPKFRRTPRDINIALRTDRAEAETLTNELLDMLKKAGQNVRTSPYWQFHIQSFKKGKWILAVDIHFGGMPKNEQEWQYYPKEDLSRGKTEKEAKLIDLFDTYALMATGVEFLKKDSSKKLQAEQAEKLISRWKELYANIIDFKNTKIKGHPDLTL